MKNIIELRDELINVFNDVKADNMDHKKAKELNVGAGKIMTSLKIQMDYARLHKKKVKIEFMLLQK